MSFDVAASAYGRFMGRFSETLAHSFAESAGLPAGARVLDVGCGPGALTAVLVDRFGADHVTAIDPSPPFVAAARERFPEVAVHEGSAEALPFADDSFDGALAQLVVHFMADAVAGLAEMARVTRPGGPVAACVWDHGTDRGPLSPFWRAAREVVPDLVGEEHGAGARPGHLRELAIAAGLSEVEDGELAVSSDYATFAEWWSPYLEGVGPAGDLVASLDDTTREAVRRRAAEQLGPGPLTVTATAWTVRGLA